MQLRAVIFDMDGVLIDSEPFWQEAGNEVLKQFGHSLTEQQHLTTTGLRTSEWIHWWFCHFKIDLQHAAEAGRLIEQKTISQIKEKGQPMPGVEDVVTFFESKKFVMGLATSSPTALIEVVIDKLDLRKKLSGYTSASQLTYGKPHPQVYLDCAEKIEVSPMECVCFEDSFNGLIAAKAARMKCVVIPAAPQKRLAQWGAADLKLNSLSEFNEMALGLLQ